MNASILIGLVIGTALGCAAAWLFLRPKIGQGQEQLKGSFAADLATREAQLVAGEKQIQDLSQRLATAEDTAEKLRHDLGEATTARAKLETVVDDERKAAEEKLQLVNDAQAKLQDVFKALSADALKSNNQSFLELARTHLEKFQESAQKDLDTRQKAITKVVAPVKDSLEKVDNELRKMEKERISSYTSLNEQVKSLALTQSELKGETSKLVRALRTPNVRGRWGEIQLKRVVEIAGMLPYCDFDEQSSKTTEEGRLRPDLIIRLPGGKNIVVDAKAPLEAYLNALESENDDEKKAFLLNHAKQIHNHMAKLSSKAYWDQFQPTPEFVVMFLPGETFFSAALEQDPHLIEEGVNQRVVLASPTTLIALLRAIAYGWQQEKLAESAQEISDLGKELFDRLCVFTEHLEKLGGSLDNAITNYNKAVGSFDSRVLVTARHFTDLGLSSNKKVPYLKQLEKSPREISSRELSE